MSRPPDFAGRAIVELVAGAVVLGMPVVRIVDAVVLARGGVLIVGTLRLVALAELATAPTCPS